MPLVTAAFEHRNSRGNPDPTLDTRAYLVFLGFTGPGVAFDREDRVAGARNAWRRGDYATRRVSTNAGKITLFLWLPCSARRNSSFDGFAATARLDRSKRLPLLLPCRSYCYLFTFSLIFPRSHGSVQKFTATKDVRCTACFRLTLVLFIVSLTCVPRAVR